ncbi:MAG TPA: PilZ domain-containing protein [bacterium]|nr:PilZ domain-containing protein [bacterium]
MGNDTDQINRRSRERKNLSTPIRAKFRLEFEGSITNISPDGLALSFSTADQMALSKGHPITLHLDMNGQMVSLEGQIQQVNETEKKITVGLKYDRDHLAVFRSNHLKR